MTCITCGSVDDVDERRGRRDAVGGDVERRDVVLKWRRHLRRRSADTSGAVTYRWQPGCDGGGTVDNATPGDDFTAGVMTVRRGA